MCHAMHTLQGMKYVGATPALVTGGPGLSNDT